VNGDAAAEISYESYIRWSGNLGCVSPLVYSTTYITKQLLHRRHIQQLLSFLLLFSLAEFEILTKKGIKR
jgi:hypothetical protein